MEAKTIGTIRPRKCWIKECRDDGCFKLSIKIPEGVIDVDVTVCEKHSDMDLVSMITNCPGVMDDLKRQTEPYGIALDKNKMLLIAEKIQSVKLIVVPGK